MSMTITFKIKKFIIALKGSVHMKKPVALTLISIMVLMLSAFSFADDYSLEIVAPDDKVIVSDWDEPFLIKILVDASVGDELEKLVVTIDEEDGDYEYTFNKKVKHVFGEDVFEYTFEAPELTPMKEFEITVVAKFDNDVEDLEASETVEVETEAEDEEEEDEAKDEDMYPAAPAIANKMLREYGIPNRVNGVNLIAAVSEAMIEGEKFYGAEKDDEDYAENVEEFLVEKLNEALDEELGNDEELDDEIDELSDLEGFFDRMDQDLVNHNVNKIKVDISDVEKVNKAAKNNEKDDDEDEDEDDDDDDDENDDDYNDDDHDED